MFFILFCNFLNFFYVKMRNFLKMFPSFINNRPFTILGIIHIETVRPRDRLIDTILCFAAFLFE